MVTESLETQQRQIWWAKTTTNICRKAVHTLIRTFSYNNVEIVVHEVAEILFPWMIIKIEAYEEFIICDKSFVTISANLVKLL